MIQVTEHIQLEESELREKFVRASGPGGQNVNKVATAVQLRFDAAGSPNLPAGVRVRLLSLAGKKATQEGVIIIEADRFRTREQNRADALERLIQLIKKAAHRPKPRRKTKPSRAAKQRRIDAKKARGSVKQTRQRVKAGDS